MTYRRNLRTSSGMTLAPSQARSPVPSTRCGVQTAAVPIVFAVGEDPVKLGLVASLARPGGNLTGVNFLNTELVTKQRGLWRELIPGTARVATLVTISLPRQH